MADYGSDNPDLTNALKKSGIDEAAPAVETGPLYKVMADSKIPVSKKLGKLWQSRIQQGQAARSDVDKCWQEAIKYYEHDQLGHRKTGNNESAGNTRFARRISGNWSETENVVFANVTTMLPMLYAKNPTITCTPINTATNQDFAACCQHLLNALLGMKSSPGLNLKPKARRGVLWALLTNSAYAKLDYIKKVDSSDGALQELQALSDEYASAKTAYEIKCIEGKLQALEEKVNILSPSGPTLKLVSPFRLVIDPTSVEPDHSDAMWIAEYDFLPTDYLNAVYSTEQDGKIVSVYDPTHVLKPNADYEASGVQEDVNNFSLFNKDDNKEARAYGYNTDAQFKAACYTKVWWVWDKTTRRLFLYADQKWEWPLWVWDDPTKLLEFYPYTHLWFHETVEGSQPKGEVTYYLDQQDAINDINSDLARARNWARLNVFYDKNKTNQADVELVLRGPDGTAKGIDVPEGMKISDMIFSMVPPNMSHPELYQNQLDQKFAAINRLTGINDAQRGAQFKTNTTNDAVDFYQKNVDIRMDEKIDAIEDWIGMIAWKLLQLCAQNMSQDDVAAVIGQEAAAPWSQITDITDLRTKLNITIVGGSTDKPTSKVKQRNAIQIAQVLGQMGGGIPAVGIVALKIIERAFKDDITITDEDWQMIMQSMNDNMNKAGAGAQGDGQQQMSPQEADQLKQQVEQLPPEAKAKMQQLIQQGASPSDALRQVTGAAQAGPAHPPAK